MQLQSKEKTFFTGMIRSINIYRGNLPGAGNVTINIEAITELIVLCLFVILFL